MSVYASSIVVGVPVERVFEFVSEPENYARWAVNFVRAPPLPGAGHPVPGRLELHVMRFHAREDIRRYLRLVIDPKRDYLTRRQHAALEAELAELEGPKRAEIVAAIASARGLGDLSENFEYHAAKDEQGMLERRIAILRARFDGAVVIDEDAAPVSGKVVIGSIVEIEDERAERMQVEISSAGGASAVSPDSPLGSALFGAREGESVKVAAPRGAWRARILSVRR